MESQEEDGQIKEKQELLKREILDKNLDQNEFISFCLGKKEKGDDLNSWSLEELTKIVEEFVASHTSSSSNEKKEEGKEKKKEEENEVKKENVENIEKVNINENKQSTEKTIECRKLEKTQLNGNKITVTIENPKKQAGGLLGKDYVTYEVKTQPFGWCVIRRYSDFDNLRKILVKFFPGFNVAPLPKKKMGNRRLEDDYIFKRMKFLRLFINSIVENESFKAHEFLLAFVSYEDRSKLEAKFKEYNSMNPSSYVEDYKTLDGKAIISHDEGNEKYFINISKYFKLQTQIFDRLNQNLKMFYNNINAVAENLQDIQKNFDILHLLNTRVVMKQTISRTYEELGQFFKNWRRILIKQNDMVKDYIKDFFKFIKLEGIAYQSLIERREELRSKYTSELSKVTSKKEKVFALNDINKMELNPDDKEVDKERVLRDKVYAFEHICYKDSLALQKIFNQLGYANKMNIYELKKMIKQYCERYIDNFKNFDANFYPTITDFIGTWTNMESFVQSSYAQQQMDLAMSQAK